MCAAAAAAAKSLQSYPTLCNPIDVSLPGSPVPGILQAGILEWVAIPFSRGSSQPRDQIRIFCVSCITGRFFTSEPSGQLTLSSSFLYFSWIFCKNFWFQDSGTAALRVSWIMIVWSSVHLLLNWRFLKSHKHFSWLFRSPVSDSC